MMNSISTIFTMDIYRDHIAKDRSEGHYVFIGRLVAFLAVVAALFLAQPFLGGMSSTFQTIQEYTGFIAPGIVGVFLLGFFWKRTNAAGAFAILFSSIALNLAAKVGLPDVPFVLRIWVVFLLCVLFGVLVSALTGKPREGQAVDLSDIGFTTSFGFNIAGVLIAAILIAIYVGFW
jgi:SSS family solute:Na+ symporter